MLARTDSANISDPLKYFLDKLELAELARQRQQIRKVENV